MRVPSERQRVARRSRSHKRSKATAATTTTTTTTTTTPTATITPAVLVKVLLYMPTELVRRIKLAAVDRDEEIAMESRAANDASGIVAIRGMSGVVAQVMTGHFALTDMMEESKRSM